ncbi:CubicO group peptidase, beta-lactamase class C family [Sphingopyxis indica]|uniref:CubicO group peptidase, beta-lactamase class C family n=2 Tax=Sphingopyxis indica TaxID=436663 RepID=A0A239FWH5_9SPHN|nr:CubicO group peptidase, beta-lactamase class C family [Sphingopyxis indica]
MRTAAIPCLAVGLARNGHVRFARGYGLADVARRKRVTVDSIFHLASVTKTVTATGITMLVEDGRLALDEPVNRHLDFAVANPFAPDVPITVRQLQMHISSISDATYYEVDFRTPGRGSPLALGDFLRDCLVPGGAYYSAKGSFSAHAPGCSYDYSNVGYALLGYLGSRVAGLDFRAYLQERLFRRLPMTGLAWRLGDVPLARRVIPYEPGDGRARPTAPMGFPDWPAGMLRGSIAGFMPFVAAAANGGAVGPARMLNASSMAEMLAMHAPPGLPTWLSGQGVDWMESAEGGARHVNHWGGDPGVFTAAYLDPASTTGIAIFTNISATAASKGAIKAITRRLLDPDASSA